MPRYIDADKLNVYFETLANQAEMEGLYNMAHVHKRSLQIIKDAPAADVVPRSEVEKAKQEVAREIFEEASKRFEVLLKDYPCEGDLVSAKKFLDFHWKPIVRSIMADYMPTSKRNT